MLCNKLGAELLPHGKLLQGRAYECRHCWCHTVVHAICMSCCPPPAAAPAAHTLLLWSCRKLTFKKGTLPAKKLEEMGPVIKELK